MPLGPRWKLYDQIIQHIGKKRRRKKQSKAKCYRHLYDPALVCPGVVVMKVVGIDIDPIKLFRNFKFEKSDVILTGYMAIAGYFLGNFDIKKNYVPF